MKRAAQYTRELLQNGEGEEERGEEEEGRVEGRVEQLKRCIVKGRVERLKWWD